MAAPATRSGRPRWPAVIAGACTALAVAALTRDGALLNSDSSAYLSTARWLQEDPASLVDLPSGTALSIRGLFGPLYPMVLAVGGTAADELSVARALGIVLAAATAYLVVRLVEAATGSLPAALVAVALVVVARSFLLVSFGFVMAEGLYTFVAVAAATATVAALDVDDRALRRRAVGIGLLVGAAFATRLVGLGTIAGAAASLWWFTAAGRRARALAVGTVVVLGVAPMALWQGAMAITDTAGPRRPGWRSMGAQEALASVEAIPATYAPAPVLDAVGRPGVEAMGVLVLAVLVAWSIGRFRAAARREATLEERACGTVLAVAWGHLAVLVGSRLFVDALVPLSGRHTMLWGALVAVAATIDGHRRLHEPAWRWARLLVLAAAAIALVAAAGPLVRSLADPRASWYSLADEPSSALEDEARATPAGVTIYTNREDLIYLRTGRRTLELPSTIDPYTRRPNPAFDDQVDALAERVADGRAVLLVYVDDDDGALAALLRRETGATVLRRDPAGVALG